MHLEAGQGVLQDLVHKCRLLHVMGQEILQVFENLTLPNPVGAQLFGGQEYFDISQ